MGAQRRESRVFSAQGPVCKELKNPVLKSKTHPRTNRSHEGQLEVTSGRGPVCLEQACLRVEEGGKALAPRQSSPLCLGQTLPPVMVPAAFLDILTVSSVPPGHFHTFCLLPPTMLQYNTAVSPFDRSANRGLRRLSDRLKLTWVSDLGGIGAQCFLTAVPCLLWSAN